MQGQAHDRRGTVCTDSEGRLDDAPLRAPASCQMLPERAETRARTRDAANSSDRISTARRRSIAPGAMAGRSLRKPCVRLRIGGPGGCYAHWSSGTTQHEPRYRILSAALAANRLRCADSVLRHTEWSIRHGRAGSPLGVFWLAVSILRRQHVRSRPVGLPRRRRLLCLVREGSLAEYPPSSSSSLTSKMISVPDMTRSVRLRLRSADSTAIGARANLLHGAIRVEPIPCQARTARVSGRAGRRRRSSGTNELVNLVGDALGGVAKLLHRPVGGVALGHVGAGSG